MMEAQNLFANSRVNITAEGKRHLGAVIGSTEYCCEYVKGLVEDWDNQLTILPTIAETHLLQLSQHLPVGLKANLTTS